jgi:hypothetical protein
MTTTWCRSERRTSARSGVAVSSVILSLLVVLQASSSRVREAVPKRRNLTTHCLLGHLRG